MDKRERTALCSVVFADIVAFAEKSVDAQVRAKAHFSGVIADALTDSADDDRIVLDTGDGAALCFLGNPEEALTAARKVWEASRDPSRGSPIYELRIGVNLGPVRVVTDINGQVNVIGDGMNVGQRIVSFARPGQLLVSRSFFEVVSRISEDQGGSFRNCGARRDKHGREHDLYEVLRVGDADDSDGGPQRSIVARETESGWDPGVLSKVADALSAYIGPIAGKLVNRETWAAKSFSDLCLRVSRFIVSEEDRGEFLPKAESLEKAEGPRVAQEQQQPCAHSIAVLPFADMSADRDQDYFCEGIAEEILNFLTKIEGLHVVSRTSSFQFKGAVADVQTIGRRLNATCLLEGSVRKSGDKLRITAQLINVSDGYHLWSARYDRKMEDVFAIQDEIAHNIVKALEVTLSPREEHAVRRAAPRDVNAYDYYLRGRQFFHRYGKKNLEFAKQMFNRAIEFDPEYALAHAGLADCSSLLYMYFRESDEVCRDAIAHCNRALELDPTLAEAHTSCGLAFSLRREYDEAEKAFEAAIRLDPNIFEAYYLYARVCFTRGKIEKAAQLYELASAVRPEDYQALLLLRNIYDGMGRKADAEDACRRGLDVAENQIELNPDDARALCLGQGAWIYLGFLEKGLEWGERAVAIDPMDSAVLYNVACGYVRAGELDMAVDVLEKTLALGYPPLEWMEQDSDISPLWEHPRFKAVVEEFRKREPVSPASQGSTRA
ncbi:MAG: tetratricopeptide repeat protein [Armatimonadetes bacterium]|nr:tetratricopeptide repeat protein [Armatimonadota bacterium]